MKYRRFGKLDWKPSALGFGAMRLPILDGDAGKINEPLAIEMIRYAINNGVNYMDSAYPYHKEQSEIIVGKALRDGYRERVKLATKMPCWLVNTADDFDKYFNEQLRKLQTNKVDFYLLHGLGKKSWPKVQDLGVLKWAEKKLDEGKIGYLGFSFHDELPSFKEIVDAHEWTFCQIQYNYMDTNYQAGMEGLHYAAKNGLAVVVMEPIAGGRLAIDPPDGIKKLWREGHHRWKPAEWALQWVWNQPEVSLLLSGMSAMQHVEENVKAADRSGVGKLTRDDIRLIDRVAKKYKEMGFVGCTGCRYCTPCPSGVAIPDIFAIFNEFYMKDRDPAVKAKYREQLKQDQWAKNCTRCGCCEDLCPQHLPIRELLRGAGETLEMNM
ncbi:MAG: aldo/keto reductase [Candidatus Bathyarchaeia archaeon]|jgi:predicted aldo/keto reductase-like oxidoreductase